MTKEFKAPVTQGDVYELSTAIDVCVYRAVDILEMALLRSEHVPSIYRVRTIPHDKLKQVMEILKPYASEGEFREHVRFYHPV